MANNNDLFSMSTVPDALPTARLPMDLESKFKKLSISGAMKKPKKTSNRTGVIFPVGRIIRVMWEAKYPKHLAADVPVFLAGVLEYLTAEILELAGNEARNKNKTRIRQRDIQLAMWNDDELNILCRDWAYANGLVRAVRSKYSDDDHD